MTCAKCDRPPIHVDDEGKGYCLSCWQGGALKPGTKCAELMRRNSGSVIGGKGVKDYWVVGTTVYDPKQWNWKIKTKVRPGSVYTLRKAVGRLTTARKEDLLPIRKGMPAVRLYEFHEVFG